MGFLRFLFFIVMAIGFLSYLQQIGLPFLYILLLIVFSLVLYVYWVKYLLKNQNFKYKIPKFFTPRYFASDREMKKYVNYLRLCRIRGGRYFVITSQNQKMILPSLNISEEDKKKIINEAQSGNEVIVSEKAFDHSGDYPQLPARSPLCRF